jgi:ABC-2 type transport system permease protein
MMTFATLTTTGSRERPSLGRAVAAFVRLEVRRTLANRRYLMFVAGFPVFFYLLYTNIGQQGDVNAVSVRDFLLVSMATYGAIGAALQVANSVAAERASGWTRQLRVTPLPPLAYVAAKMVSSFVTSLPALLLVSAAAIIVNHVALPLTTWAQLIGLLAVATIPFVGLGVLIGLTVGSESAQIVVMPVYLGLAIVGGLWIPLASLPDAVAAIGRWLPSYRAADLGWTTVAGQPISLSDIGVLVAYAVVIGAIVAWAYRRQELTARA